MGYSENVKFMVHRELTGNDPRESALGVLFDISICSLGTRPGPR